MAAIEFTGKEIYSRVLQAVPGASENYVINLINEALIGVVRFNPSKKHNILITTPKTAQTIIYNKSVFLIFSFIKNE